MRNRTLREIYEEYGISRRAIQGYEKEGLVHATAKMKRGYLLYNEDMVNRMIQIRFYQDIGYRVKQIKYIIDATNDIKKDALVVKLDELKSKNVKTSDLILKVERMIAEL
ncbi:MAG: MerR family transcriptional regulator [Lachnospiraceae bacterium]|nr:MerR family transcriptional regulator [Lachnospiraceae bacterium]